MEAYDGDGAVCVLSSGFKCEEWALLRGECPEAGLDVTGLSRPEWLCRIRGGEYLGEWKPHGKRLMEIENLICLEMPSFAVQNE